MKIKQQFMRTYVLALAAILVLGLSCQKSGNTQNSIEVEDVWSRPAAVRSESDMSSTGVVYLTITNTTGQADHLLAVTSDIAEVVEIHTMIMENEVMRMRSMPEGVEIPASGKVEFKPGGMHIMLIGLKRSLKVGERFAVTLEFKRQGKVSVESIVREP